MLRPTAASSVARRPALAWCALPLAALALTLAGCGKDDQPNPIPSSGERETTTSVETTTTIPGSATTEATQTTGGSDTTGASTTTTADG